MKVGEFFVVTNENSAFFGKEGWITKVIIPNESYAVMFRCIEDSIIFLENEIKAVGGSWK